MREGLGAEEWEGRGVRREEESRRKGEFLRAFLAKRENLCYNKECLLDGRQQGSERWSSGLRRRS